MDQDRLRHQTSPILRLPEPKFLLDGLVLEVFVVLEAEFEREAARRALGVLELESGDLERIEALGEDFGVGRLDEVVDLWRRLLEDERPKVWDFGEEVGALLVQGSVERLRFADCTMSVWTHYSLSGSKTH